MNAARYIVRVETRLSSDALALLCVQFPTIITAINGALLRVFDYSESPGTDDPADQSRPFKEIARSIILQESSRQAAWAPEQIAASISIFETFTTLPRAVSTTSGREIRIDARRVHVRRPGSRGNAIAQEYASVSFEIINLAANIQRRLRM